MERGAIEQTSNSDDVFEALASSHRRQLLFTLAETDPRPDERFDPFELLGVGDETELGKTTQIQLVHVHLPKLSEWGFVDWNQGTRELTTGPSWDDIAPVLEVIRENPAAFPGELP